MLHFYIYCILKWEEESWAKPDVVTAQAKAKFELNMANANTHSIIVKLINQFGSLIEEILLLLWESAKLCVLHKHAINTALEF